MLVERGVVDEHEVEYTEQYQGHHQGRTNTPVQEPYTIHDIFRQREQQGRPFYLFPRLFIITPNYPLQ